MKLYKNLLPHEASFALWLEDSAPYLLPLWDFEEGRYMQERVDDYLGVCSSGQAVMCKFALEVWTGGRGNYDFNLFKAMRYLGDKELKVIKDWVNNPWCC
ncbi:hypothetical protein H4J56_15055 [Colwellia sp. BRX8-4]|jgi:hypothetical protein|uniref:hypothetical protein n=1 Tax=Colwellia sp. BRX8-4 TaxID=2759836 RepID=UPI0015F6A88E|nr:hypothetical protein [Colwellia sp. BRX8-4]MBA6365813.1 hypothetical protein [Colwellia sp. BRX8-8]MBA6372740.1 hypothetical protein [Colwellia sp. BRX8-4]